MKLSFINPPKSGKPFSLSRLKNSRGVTLIETLVSLVLVATLFGLTVSQFFQSARGSYDHQVVSEAEENARTILDMLVYDIRMMGTGMPLGQTNFPLVGGGLGDTQLPILVTSNVDYIEFRLNEKGANTYITEDYTPNLFDLDVDVYSAANLEVGDKIYISDMMVGGISGFAGTIDAISGDTVTFNSTYTVSPAAMFAKGSSISNVKTVMYDSPATWSGITRDTGSGPVVLSPNSTFTLEYLDRTGTAIGLPLTPIVIANDLASIRVTTSVRSSKVLTTNDTTYTAVTTQVVALRNLILNRD